jgi:hypothetical protein
MAAGVGVPARVAVPSPLSVNVSPGGRSPDSATEALGAPSVVIVNAPRCPTTNQALSPEVRMGAPLPGTTVSVKCWTAL